MPKKLPIYWPDNATCNKVGSKPLRVLRDRPNKLNSTHPTLHSFCNTFKPKHFKADKKEKFDPVEEFHGFISSEGIISRHTRNNRSRLRQLQADQTYGILKTVKNLTCDHSWKKKYMNAMAVEFDHMYINCDDSKISIGRDIEIGHLKHLNMLHLDLIQQLTEQVTSKEKIIQALREENNNLRARLERIDRRLSLSLQKKPNALSPISVQTDFSSEVNFPFCLKSEGTSPKLAVTHRSPARSPNIRGICDKPSSPKVVSEDEPHYTENQLSKRESLRNLSPKQINSSISPHSPLPQIVRISPQILRISPREKRAKRESSDSLLNTQSIVNNDTHLLSSLSPTSCDSRKLKSPSIKRTLTEEAMPPQTHKKSKSSEVEDKKSCLSPAEEEGITNHSLRSRNKSKDSHEEVLCNHTPKSIESSSLRNLPESLQHINEKLNSNVPVNNICSSIDTEKWKQSFKAGVETRKVRGEGILTTSESYYLPSHHFSHDFLDVPGDEEQAQVEIPKWRIKVLTSLYVMEGTENLEEEIFVKRHAKPEQDERRRKRWDLQRMREQRQYEKLRERYEGRNNPNGSSGCNPHTLWPSPDCAQNVQIDNYLPVCAFGQPLARILESDFFVPWLTGKSPLQVGLSTRRKKR